MYWSIRVKDTDKYDYPFWVSTYNQMLADIPGDTMQAKLRLLVDCYKMNCGNAREED